MPRPPIDRFRRSVLASAIAGLAFAPTAQVIGNPSGAEVIRGDVDFQTFGNELTITNTPGSIIDWQDFSIAQDEITRFQQEAANSAVLNRVVGGSVSEILGQLVSNGQVFLINPNGVVFGQSVTIDTAGFVASTLDMANEDFLAGDYLFQDGGNAGRIVNEGYLATRGGNVFFVAADIENSGIIHTEDGSLVLAAGERVRIRSLDTPDIEFEVASPENEIINLGALLADQGAVKAFAGTLTHSGEVRADSVALGADGSIVLFAEDALTLEAGSVVEASGTEGGDVLVQSESGTVLAGGRIEAEGNAGAGGRIRLLGAQVGVVDQGVVSADGSSGGGEILIGGNLKGQGPEPNADAVFVGADTNVTASATIDGDGGTVIAFGTELLRMQGVLSARGGPEGGDGGFVETSAVTGLEISTAPDVSSPDGTAGTWLIDPAGIRVVADGPPAPPNPPPSDGGPGLFQKQGGGVNDLEVGFIDLALGSGATVELDATSGAPSSAGIEWTSGALLDLSDNTGPATLRLRALQEIDFFGNINDPNGVLSNLEFFADGIVTVSNGAFGNEILAPAAQFLIRDSAGGMTQSLDVSSASISVDTLDALTLNVAAGSVSDLDATTQISLTFLNLNAGGTLNTSAPLISITEDAVIDGTIFGQGTQVTVGGGATPFVSIGGAADATLHNVVLVAGAGVDATLFGNITMENGARIENAGNLGLENGTAVLDGGVGAAPGGIFNQAGGLADVAPLAVASLDVPFVNEAGAILNLDDAVLTLNGGGSNAGTITLGGGQAGSTLDVRAGPDFLVLEGATFVQSGPGPGVLNVDGGTVDLQNTTPVTIPNLTLSAGTLTGTGDAEISGVLDWFSGTLSGTGATTLSPGGVGAISTAVTKNLVDRDLIVQGNLDWIDGDVDLAGTASIAVEGGTFAINQTASVGNLRSISGTPSFTIDATGTLTDTSVQPVIIDVALANDGTVNANGNQLTFQRGGTSAGDFDVGPGSQLTFVDNDLSGHVLNGALTGMGTVRFPSTVSTQQVNGSYAVLNTQVSGDVDFNTIASTDSLTLSNGSLGGTGDVEVTGSFTQTGGTVANAGDLILSGTSSITTNVTHGGAGRTIVPADAFLSIDGGTFTLNGTRQLLVEDVGAGTLPGQVQLNLTRDIVLAGDSRITNFGVIELAGTGGNSNDIVDGTGGTESLFENFGTLVRTGDGTTLISVDRTEQHGIFDLNVGATRSNSIINHNAGSTVVAGAANYLVDSGSTQTFVGAAFSDGVEGPGGFSITGGTVVLLDDPVTTGVAEVYAVGDFVHNGGILEGDADLILTGSASIAANSTMRGSAFTVITEDALLSLNGGNLELAGTRTLVVDDVSTGSNPGLLRLTGTRDVILAGDSTLTNFGVIELAGTGANSNDIVEGAGGTESLFENFGTLLRTGDGTTFVTVDRTEQHGTFDLNVGTTSSNSIINHNPGSTLVAGAANYLVSGGSTQTFVGATFSDGVGGDGGFSITGGTAVLLDDPITTGVAEVYSFGDFVHNGGTLEGDADLILTGSASIAANSTMRGSAFTVIAQDALVSLDGGNLTLDGTRTLQIDDVTTGTNPGLLRLTGTRDVILAGDSTLTNFGVIELAGTGSNSNDILDGIGGSESLFENFGTLLRTGDGTTFVTVDRTEQHGTFDLNVGTTSSNSIINHNPGSTLVAGAANYLVSGGSTQTFVGATFSDGIGGDGGFSITGGTAVLLDDPVTTGVAEVYAVGDFVHNGGTLEGDADLILTGSASIAANSTMRGSAFTVIAQDALVSLDGGNLTLDGTRTLQIDDVSTGTNPGLLRLTGTRDVILAGDSTLTNFGVIELAGTGSNSNDILDGIGGSESLFENFGTLLRTGDGTTNIAANRTEQHGTFDLNVGTTSSNSIINHNPGSILVASASTYLVSSGSIQNFVGTVFSDGAGGDGGLSIASGTAVFLDDPVTTGIEEVYAVGDFVQSGGVLDGDADFVLTGSGVIASVATMRGTGSFVVDQDASFTVSGGTLTLREGRGLATRAVTTGIAPGTLFIDGSRVLALADDSFIDNAGRIDITGTGDIVDNANGAGFTIGSQLLNSGTFARTGTGVSSILSVEQISGSGSFELADDLSLRGALELSGTASVTGAGALAVDTGGTLGVAAGSTISIDNLRLAAGSLFVDGDLTLNQTWEWTSSGSLTGSSGASAVVASGATLSILNSSFRDVFGPTDGRFVLRNEGTMNWNAGQLDLHEGADLLNAGVLNIDVATSSTLDLGTATVLQPSFQSTGTLAKAGTDRLIIDVPYDVTGTVSVTNGRLSFTRDGIFDTAATVSPTGSIRFSESIPPVTHTWTTNAAFTGGGVVDITGGTVNVPAGAIVDVANLELNGNGATLSGDGTARVSGTFDFVQGLLGDAMSTTGELQLLTGSLNTLTGGLTKTIQGNYTLRNEGLLELIDGSLAFGDTADFVNAGTFRFVQFDGTNATGQANFFELSAATPSFVSTGTIEKIGSADLARIAVPSTIGGFVDVADGTLQYDALASHGAAYTIDSLGEVEFLGSAQTLTTGSAFSGLGLLTLNGTPLSVTVDVPVDTLVLTGFGTIAGAGTVTVGNSFVWESGTIGNNVDGGALTLASGATGSIPLTSVKNLVNATLTLGAGSSTIWGAGDIRLSEGAVLDVRGSLALDADTFLQDQDIGAASAVANTGTIFKDSSTGTTSFDVLFDNDGTVDVSLGTLSLLRDGTHDGDFVETAPGAIEFTAGTHTITALGSFNSDADVIYDAETLSIDGGFSAGNVTIQNASTITFNGAYDAASTTIDASTAIFGSLGNTGDLTITNGTVQGLGSLFVGGTAVLDGATFRGMSTTTFTSTSSVTGTGATLLESGGAIFEGALAIDALTASSGFLDVNTTGSTTNLVVSGGNVASNGDLSVLGNFQWTSGTIGGGTGRISVAPSASGTINTTAPKVLGSGTLAIDSTAGVNWSNGNMEAGDGGILEIGGLLLSTHNNSAGFSLAAGPGATGTEAVNILSSGTFQRNGGFDLELGIALNNEGRTLMSSGSLSASAGGVSGGSFDVAGSGGFFNFSGGTHTLLDGVAGSGTTGFNRVTGGTVTFNGVTGGISRLSVNGGQLASNGTFVIDSGFGWTSGTIGGGSGEIRVAPSASGTINGTALKLLDSGTLAIDSTAGVTWSNGNMEASGGGMIEIGGLLLSTHNNSAGFSLSEGTGATGTEAVNIVSGGTFRRNGGFDLEIGIALNNDGRTRMSSGSLSASAGGVSGGSFDVDGSGGFFNFAGGTHTLLDGVSGIGTAGFNRVTGGTVTFDGVTGGISRLSVNGGQLASNGNLVIDSGFGWTSGTIGGGTGRITVAPGASGTINSSALKFLDSGTLAIDSTAGVIWSDGNMEASNGGMIEIGGLLLSTHNNSAGFSLSEGTGATGTEAVNIVSGGTFRRNGAFDLEIGIALNNDGRTLMSSGSLSASAGGVSGGSFDVDGSGGFFNFAGGTHTLLDGVSGIGTAGFNRVTGGTVTFDGVTGGISRLSVNGGQLASNGNLVIDSGFGWTSGTIGGGTGRITVAPGASGTINSTALKSLDSGTLAIDSTAGVIWSDGNMEASNGGVLEIGGLLLSSHSNSAGYSLAEGTGALGTEAVNILSAGTFQRNGAFDLEIGIALNNDGRTLMSSGSLSASAGGSSGGSFDVNGSGGFFNFAGGAHTLLDGVSGTGTAGFNQVTGGTVTFTGVTGGISRLSVNGGQLASNGTFVIDSGFGWTSGTIGGGTGRISVAPSASGTISGTATKFLDSGTLAIDSTAGVTWSNGSMEANSDGILEIGGLLISSHSNSAGFSLAAGAGAMGAEAVTIAPGGTFQRNGAFDLEIGIALNNDGRTLMSAGSLSASGGGTSSGSFDVDGSAGTFNFAGGMHTLADGVSGTGTAGFNQVTGGTVTFTGVTGGISRLSVNGGQLASNGAFVIDSGFGWTSGTIGGGTGRISVAPSASGTISGTATKFLDSGTLAIDSTTGVTWSNGSMEANNGGIIEIGGLLTSAHSNSAGFTLAAGGASTGAESLEITPTGTLRRNGAFDLTVGIALGQNTPIGGTIDSASGNLNFDAFANLGPTASIVADQGIIRFRGNGVATGSAFTANGAGVIDFGAAFTLNDATLDGTGTIAGNPTINATLTTIDSPMSFRNASITTTGTLAINAAVTLEGTVSIDGDVTNNDSILIQGVDDGGAPLNAVVTMPSLNNLGFITLTSGAANTSATLDVLGSFTTSDALGAGVITTTVGAGGGTQVIRGALQASGGGLDVFAPTTLDDAGRGSIAFGGTSNLFVDDGATLDIALDGATGGFSLLDTAGVNIGIGGSVQLVDAGAGPTPVFSWSGTTIEGPGVFDAEAATITLTGGTQTLNGADLLATDLTIAAGQTLRVIGAGAVETSPGGTTRVLGTLNLEAGTLLANGPLEIDGTGGTTAQLLIDDSVLAVSNGGFVEAGTISIGSLGSFGISGATFEFRDDSLLTGTGSASLGGAPIAITGTGTGFTFDINQVVSNTAFGGTGNMTITGDLGITGTSSFAGSIIVGAGGRLRTATIGSTPTAFTVGTLATTTGGTIDLGGGAGSTITVTDAPLLLNDGSLEAFGSLLTLDVSAFGLAAQNTAIVDVQGELTLNTGPSDFTLQDSSLLVRGSGDLLVSGTGGLSSTNSSWTIQDAPAVIQMGSTSLVGTDVSVDTSLAGGLDIGSANLDWGTDTTVSLTAGSLLTAQNISVTGIGTQTLTGGAVDLSGDLTIGASSPFSATSAITALGSVITSGGSTTLDGTLDASAIEVSGFAPLTLNGATTAGQLTVDSGTILGSGTLDVSGTSSLSGATFSRPGDTTLMGLASGTGATFFDNGTTTFAGGLSLDALTVDNGTVIVSAASTATTLAITGGTLDVQAPIATDDFTLSVGELLGTGTTTVNVGGTLSGGFMSGATTLAIAPTATVNVDGGVGLRDTHAIDNQGVLAFTADGSLLELLDDAALLNQATGTIDFQAGGDLIDGTDTLGTVFGSQLLNSGEIRKSGAGIDASVVGITNVTMQPASLVRVDAGELLFTNFTTFDGDALVDTGTLRFTGGGASTDSTITLNNGGIADFGTFTFTNPTLLGDGTGTLIGDTGLLMIVDEALTFTNTDVQTAGTLRITEFGTLTLEGTVNVDGDVTNEGQLTIFGSSDAGGATVTLPSLDNLGSLLLTGDGGTGATPDLFVTGAFTSSGSIHVDTNGAGGSINGTLQLTGGSLRIDGDLNLNPGAAGNFVFGGDSLIAVNSNAFVVTSLSDTTPDFVLADSASLDLACTPGNCEFALNDATTLGTGRFVLDGGTISGGGLVDTFGAAFLVTGTSTFLEGRVSAQDVTIGEGARLDLRAGGTLTANGTTRIEDGNLTVDGATLALGGALELQGIGTNATLNVTNATLNVDNGGFAETTAIGLGAGGTLSFGDGLFAFRDGSAISGEGAVRFAGAVIDIDATTSSFVLGAAAEATDQNFGGTGSLLISESGSLTLGGTVNVGGAVTNQGLLTVFGAADTGGARVTLPSLDNLGSLVLTSDGGTGASPELSVTGTFSSSGSIRAFQLGGGASITGALQLTGGTFDIENDLVLDAGPTGGIVLGGDSVTTVSPNAFVVARIRDAAPDLVLDAGATLDLNCGAGSCEFGIADLTSTGTGRFALDGGTIRGGGFLDTFGADFVVGGLGSVIEGRVATQALSVLNGGQLDVRSGGSLTASGSARLEGGALTVGGTLTAAGLDVLAGDALFQSAANVTDITVSGGTATFQNGFTRGGATLDLTGGFTQFEGDASLDTLRLAGGALGGAGRVTILSSAELGDGEMTGTGTTEVTASATLAPNVSVALNDGRTLLVDGTRSLASLFLTSGSTGSFRNAGTLEIAQPAIAFEPNLRLENIDTTNTGTLRLLSDPDLALNAEIIGGGFENSGTVEALHTMATDAEGFANGPSGSLLFEGSTLTNTGTITVRDSSVRITASAADFAPGGTLSVQSTTRTNPASGSFGAACCAFLAFNNNATGRIAGTVDLDYLDVSRGADVLLETDLALSGFEVSTYTFTTQPVPPAASSVIRGTADIEVQDSFFMVGGNLALDGTVTVREGARFGIGLTGPESEFFSIDFPTRISGTTLRNESNGQADSFYRNAIRSDLILDQGATLENAGTLFLDSTWADRAARDVALGRSNPVVQRTPVRVDISGDGSSMIRNEGRLESSNGSPVRLDQVSLANTGAIVLDAPVLALDSLSASTLTMSGGSLTVNGAAGVARFGTVAQTGGTVDGPGTFAITGAATLSGGLQEGTGTTRIESTSTTSLAALTVGADRLLEIRGALQVEGTADGTAPAALSLARVLLDGGSLTTNRTLTITDVATLNGTLAGTVAVADTATGSLGALQLQTDAALLNAGALTFESTAISGDASARFTNQGSLAGSGTLELAVSTTNSGTISASSLNLAAGTTLLNSGSASSTGAFDAAGTIQLADGTIVAAPLTLGASGVLTGNGTVNGQLVNGGLVSPGNSPGAITVDGDYVQTADGRLFIEIDGAAAEPGVDFDALVITGNATFDGTLQLETLGSFEGTLGANFVPISFGSSTGNFANVQQPTNADVVFDPVIGPNGVETTLSALNGETLGTDPDAPIDPTNPPRPENEQEARDIADEVIAACPDQREEVAADNNTQRERENAEREQGARTDAPDERAAPPGTQGVGCVTS